MAIYINSFVISSLLTFLFTVQLTLSQQHGFTTNLIHRESPLSPLKTPSLNQYERLRKSIERSMYRINRFRTTATTDDVHSNVKETSKGEYVMELSFGTPPVTQLGVIDTGSDLIWTQCQPCLKCYNQTLPIFEPNKSSTYESKSCNSQTCNALSKTQSSCSNNNTCGYIYKYGDGSRSIGDMASETLTFNSGDNQKAVSFSNISFGCGYMNTGLFSGDVSGLVGLGGGPLSLVSQLNSSINGKFSYCLIGSSMESNYTSKINFGTNAVVSGSNVISTPIVKGEPNTFYYLTLEGISVEKTKIPSYNQSSIISSSTSRNDITKKGNMIIDSGTTLTFLPPQIFSDFKSTLEGVINGEKVKDPSGHMDLCYKLQNGENSLHLPNVTAHFTGGDLVLQPYNTFVRVSDEVICLAIVPSDGRMRSGILGYVAQTNILVGYDTVEGKVSFKPTNCTME